jgi:hypothetical protein
MVNVRRTGAEVDKMYQIRIERSLQKNVCDVLKVCRGQKNVKDNLSTSAEWLLQLLIGSSFLRSSYVSDGGK